MKSMPLQERIVFLFLEAIRRARALLVPGAHVTRNRLAERLGFGAFESDDFLGHKLLLAVVGLGFLFLAFGPFFIGETEEGGHGLPDARGLVLLLELRLAFDGEPRKRDRLEPCV